MAQIMMNVDITPFISPSVAPDPLKKSNSACHSAHRPPTIALAPSGGQRAGTRP